MLPLLSSFLVSLQSLTLPYADTNEAQSPALPEEQYSRDLYRYEHPPETVEATIWLDSVQLRYASEIELSQTLRRMKLEIEKCSLIRTQIEGKIGVRPGSYSVHTKWVRVYQNCLIARRQDLREFDNVLNRMYVETVSAGGAEGATTQTVFIDRLRARLASLQTSLSGELKTQKKFVAYYNTGIRSY